MIKRDCRYFRAAKPCDFNKQYGAECPSCTHFSPFRDRVLFIKLDAIGDVLRSASLLPAVVGRHDKPFIAWLTRPESVELVSMMDLVDEVIPLSTDALARLPTGSWTQVYSLSNDPTSAALASLASGSNRLPVGYFLEGGVVTPGNAAAEAWLNTAAFDRIKRANTETYQRRMMAILGSDAPVPRPALSIGAALRSESAARIASLFPGSERPRVAINMGSGSRWPKKMLGVEAIAQVIAEVEERAKADFMLVGGAAERDKTAEVLDRVPGHMRVAAALTPDSIGAFVATLAQANVLLCGDTLALHIATAIGLPTVAVFGPTSRAEIADFGGLIEKLSAESLDCLCCYGDCDKTANCMTLLDPREIAARIVSRLPS